MRRARGSSTLVHRVCVGRRSNSVLCSFVKRHAENRAPRSALTGSSSTLARLSPLAPGTDFRLKAEATSTPLAPLAPWLAHNGARWPHEKSNPRSIASTSSRPTSSRWPGTRSRRAPGTDARSNQATHQATDCRVGGQPGLLAASRRLRCARRGSEGTAADAQGDPRRTVRRPSVRRQSSRNGCRPGVESGTVDCSPPTGTRPPTPLARPSPPRCARCLPLTRRAVSAPHCSRADSKCSPGCRLEADRLGARRTKSRPRQKRRHQHARSGDRSAAIRCRTVPSQDHPHATRTESAGPEGGRTRARGCGQSGARTA